LVQETFADVEISRDGTRTHERRPLPTDAERLVVADGGGDAVRDRSAATFGTKPKIHARAEPVLVVLLDRRHETPRDAAERVERPQPLVADVGPVVARVHEHDVDVAPRVELHPA